MQKRIIVEGPDGAGKTTLIATLKNRFPQLEIVPSFKKQNKEKFFDNWVFQQLISPPLTPSSIPIHDRFYYSELVYGMVLRGHVEVLPGNQRRIEQVLRDNAFLIYCNLPVEDLQRYAAQEAQMDGVIRDLPLLHEQYEHLMMDEYRHYGPRRFQHYDFTQSSTEEGLMYKLENYLG